MTHATYISNDFNDTRESAEDPPRIKEVVPKGTYLSHLSYVSLCISELCSERKEIYKITLTELVSRLHKIIDQLHGGDVEADVVHDYFNHPQHILGVLRTLSINGNLKLTPDHIELTHIQLTYIRDFLF